MSESAIEAKLDALSRSMDAGFTQVNRRIDEVKVDLKELREEGLPRRVSKLEADAETTREEGLPRRIRVLEDWRRNIGSRWWALTIGVVVTVAGTLIAVLVA